MARFDFPSEAHAQLFLTGAIRDLPDFATAAGRTTIPLRFEPEESYFIVFRAPGGRLPRRRRP